MISIVIPSYNHNYDLPNAVRSALRQNFQDKEIIVVDDGSDIPVRNVWGDPVTVLRHEENKGLSQALNTGITNSSGDRFVILAADDQLHPSFLKVTSSVDKDIVSVDMLASGKMIRSRPGNLELLKRSNCHSYAALVKKWVFEKTGGFNSYMNPSWEDYEFWLHAAKVGAEWGHVSVPLHIYDRNPNGRDEESSGKDILLRGKLEGFHQDVFGKGRGLVSVVIPCYDHESYLGDAIESALSQTYPHVKVIVVDDGSPGNTSKVVNEFKNVALIRQRNKHLSGARNTGIKYALLAYKSQYTLPLDADDTIEPDFVEHVMSELTHNRQYAYSDVKFIGDAWHTYELPDFDCELLVKKHLHPCTILMPTEMWQRAGGYDETMKKGYEDWDFALRAVKAGYCGIRVPEYLFNYRFHRNGSMRTAAQQMNSELVKSISERHPWILSTKGIEMGCKTCGSQRYARTVINYNGGSIQMAVNVPGIGQVDSRELLKVTYSGSQENTITKVGTSGKIYKYSGNPNGTFGRVFTIFAHDAHLFPGNAFAFERLQKVPAPQPKPQVEIKGHEVKKPIPVDPVTTPTQDRLEAKMEARQEIAYNEPDDFTVLKWVGEVGDSKLKEVGFGYFEDIIDAPAEEIAQVLGITVKRAEIIKEAADKELAKLEE